MRAGAPQQLDGELIGFLAGSLKTLPRYFGGFLIGFISEVFVSEAYRSRNVGRALVDRAAQWFKAQHVHRIELQVLLDNQAARRLYQRLGWRRTGTDGFSVARAVAGRR